MTRPAPRQGEPGKFSLSAPFDRLLAEFTVEYAFDSTLHEDRPVIVHEPCLASVRNVDEDMDLASLVQAVIDHDC